MRRRALRPVVGLTLVGVVGVAGCGSEQEQPAGSVGGGSGGESASAHAAGDAWNPCDRLETDPISEALGTEVRVDDGGDETYRCSLLPAEEGDAAFSVTYQWGSGELAETFEGMDLAPERVRSPEIADADEARMVVDAGPDAVAVTGFVQNGDLTQVVNALDLPPYERGPVVAATRVVLTQLSAAAPESPEG